jgi:hypothetical protein
VRQRSLRLLHALVTTAPPASSLALALGLAGADGLLSCYQATGAWSLVRNDDGCVHFIFKPSGFACLAHTTPPFLTLGPSYPQITSNPSRLQWARDPAMEEAQEQPQGRVLGVEAKEAVGALPKHDGRGMG